MQKLLRADGFSRSSKSYWRLLLIPAIIVCTAFFLLPISRLMLLSVKDGWLVNYQRILVETQYWQSLLNTLLLSAGVTVLTLLLSVISGLFLTQHRFWGRSGVIAMLTFPLAFPGVVIGFFVIMLSGRQGLTAQLGKWLVGDKWVLAYSLTGLFIGYVYFSIPRVIVTVMASAEKIDTRLLEAAQSLHANAWQVFRDVTLPALMPGLIASGSVCFATAMGAFGTAFTLATKIDVLPMSIYTEFTLSANFGMAAALSVVLGVITWVCLAVANHYQDSNTNINLGG